MLIGLAGCIGPFRDTKGVPGTVDKRTPGNQNGNGNGNGNGDDWLADVGNHDGVVDMTGQDQVEVQNGEIPEVDQQYAFEPAEIQIDPGTTVQWTWVGSVGHSVTNRSENSEELFNSDIQSGEGTTFEYTFESTGVYDYYCIPHQGLGQKGRVRVGNAAQINSWMSGVGNFDGSLEDFTGQDSVTVQNGEIPEVDQQYAFDPPGITVSTGTSVTWEWVGSVGHSVTNRSENSEELFNSEIQSGEGTTFEYTFDSAGVFPYFCIPHQGLGQKGIVVVEE
jgi:halocyanin-like protein